MLDLLVITGASKGIGASIATKCSSIAKNMIVIASSDAIQDKKSNNCMPLQLNLFDHQECKKAINNAVSVFEPVNSIGIVLCGAQLGNPGGLLDAVLGDWDTTYRTNVLGNLAVVQGCSRIIKTGAKTRIAFFAGGGAAFGYPEWSGYSLSKVAVVRAAENLGLELAKTGQDASVIAVAPGAVATDMLAKVIASGAEIRTKTDISEPTNFIYKFLNDEFPSGQLNGKFLHVRDDIDGLSKQESPNPDIFKLRRIQ